jgi:hypothetical protein
MYLFIVDGVLANDRVVSPDGMPTMGICAEQQTTNLRNMGISGGTSQVPAMALPRDEDARRELAYTNRFDFTAKGVVALAVIASAAFAGLFLLRSDYWYLGVAFLVAVPLLFFGPFFRITRPQVRRRISND